MSVKDALSRFIGGREAVRPVEDEMSERDWDRLFGYAYPPAEASEDLRRRITEIAMKSDTIDRIELKEVNKRRGFYFANRRLSFGILIFIFSISFAFFSEHGPSLASRVIDASRSVSTWKASGWKVMHGKRVQWEVEWRRSPFFYRERIGDDLALDDGVRRIHIRPDARIVTIGPSVKGDPLPWTGIQRNGEIVSRTHERITYRIYESERDPAGEPTNRATWILSKSSYLPVSRILERGESGDWKPVEYAEYRYNQKLPTSLAQLNIPKSMRVLNLTNAKESNKSPDALTRSSGAMKAKVQPLAMDSEGAVAISIEAWLDGMALGGANGAVSDFNPGARDIATIRHTFKDDSVWSSGSGILRDDRGRAYLMDELDASIGITEMERSPKRYLLFPLIPFPPADPKPRYLLLPLSVTASLSTKLSGYDKWIGSQSLTEGRFLFRIPCPKTSMREAIGKMLSKKDLERWLGETPGYIAEDQAMVLGLLKRYRESAERWKRSISVRPRIQGGDERKLELAKMLEKNGEREEAKRALEEFIAEDLPKISPHQARENDAKEARRLRSELNQR